MFHHKENLMLTVKVYPDQNFDHMTQIISGLYDLAAKGRIRLEFTSNFENEVKNTMHQFVLWMQITDNNSGKVRRVCFDLFDAKEIHSFERLTLCDVYFKRSYNSEYINRIEESNRTKIFPYGLNFRCRTKNERHFLKRFILFHLCRKTLFKKSFQLLHSFFIEFIEYILLKRNIELFIYKPLTVEDFLRKPDEPTEDLILFQTRVWHPEEVPAIDGERLKDINDMRAETVRALRKRFGKQFVGGLAHTELAREYYSDCLAYEKTDRKSYINIVKKGLIGITTTGLHGSIGGKLPEYLAASMCVITEPLECELPLPLVDNENYLTFSDPDECIHMCERILDNPHLQEQMREQNYKYFLNQAEPSQIILKCLTKAIEIW